MDTLENVATFLTVVKNGSFSAAARGLNTVPSVVSKRIGQLEHRLKTQLFVRSTRRLTLTEAGERFYPRLQAAYAEMQEAFEDLAASQSRLEERLRIKCPTTLTVQHFGTILTGFQVAHPGVRLDLVLMDRSVNPVEEGFDIAIGALPSSYFNVVDVPLCPMRRVAVASPGYLAKAGNPEHPRDLLEHTCLTFMATGTHWAFESNAGVIDIDVRSSIGVNDSQVLINAVEQDLGVAIVAEHIARASIEAGTLVTILEDYPPPNMWVKALVPKSRSNNPAVLAAIKWLKDACQPLPPWDR